MKPIPRDAAVAAPIMVAARVGGRASDPASLTTACSHAPRDAPGPPTGTTEVALAITRLGASPGRPGSLGRSGENTPLRRVNQALLDALGGDWDCPPELHQGWTRGPATQVVTPARARSTWLSEFGDAPVGVWKDRRACLTLPFWLPVFDEPPVVVFVHRHPGEFAEALHGARGLGRAHALAIWERCNHDVLTHATGLPTYVVDHRQLMEDPAGVAEKLVASLAEWGVPPARELDAADLDLAPRARFHRWIELLRAARAAPRARPDQPRAPRARGPCPGRARRRDRDGAGARHLGPTATARANLPRAHAPGAGPAAHRVDARAPGPDELAGTALIRLASPRARTGP
jgi:hypothetical protein